MTTTPTIHRVAPFAYEIAQDSVRGMRVPARIFADAELWSQILEDRSVEQLTNVTTLPGIVRAAYGMPDVHEGYGFPVGGVAGTRLPDGVISPGGIGFDINCGVRLLAADLLENELRPFTEALVHEISRSIPSGFGRRGVFAPGSAEFDQLLAEGCPYLIERWGFGEPGDFEVIESGGCLPGARVSEVSERAKSRGQVQLGTLGGGNHFLEVQAVDAIFDEEAAAALGLSRGQVTILVHTGSRGLGHQVCTDYVRVMDRAMSHYGIAVPDRQLASAPLSSPEGEAYFGAMAAAANFAWCNRQVITHRIREAASRTLPRGGASHLRLVYDVGHNTAKIERFGDDRICVHRKGATRAFGPSAGELPERYRASGQPVFIPGSMGTASYVLVGTDASQEASLSSACHGAGRALSRGAAKRKVAGHEIRKELEQAGIVVRCPKNAELAEEAPLAYKDVGRVVDVVEEANLARKVARLRPLGVVKG